MNWTPVFSIESRLGSEAWSCVKTIAEALRHQDYDLPKPEQHLHEKYEKSLLYAYIAVALGDMTWAAYSAECLNESIDTASQFAGYSGLFGGITGLGWMVEHISQLLSNFSAAPDDNSSESSRNQNADKEENDLVADIDVALLKKLSHMETSTPYDLISGLVGLGVYFLERLPRKSAVEGTRAVFDRLEKMSQRMETGISWHTGPELLPDWQREECPNGYYNLGVAHGVPGVIHFVTEVWVSNIVERERCYRLLDGAIKWLIAQQRSSGPLSRFGSWVYSGGKSSESRMAWCYGDLGILSVLSQVSSRTGRSDWQMVAEELLNHCLAWPDDKTGIQDAPLCHGAAGVAHIFNRLYQTSHDRRCLEAALLWYERTLAFRKVGTGVGGFSTLSRAGVGGAAVWQARPAFLDGALGIALALLAAVAPIEPCWDRLLLLSGRFR
jgi:hypothetical protein